MSIFKLGTSRTRRVSILVEVVNRRVLFTTGFKKFEMSSLCMICSPGEIARSISLL